MIELDGQNLKYGMSMADIEKLVTSLIGPSEMSYPLESIYVIECDSNPGYSVERFFRASTRRNPPDWIGEITDDPLYIGSSSDTVKRIHEHISAEGAMFTKFFPPKRLVEIRKHSKISLNRSNYRRENQRKEKLVANEYRSKTSKYVSTGGEQY